MEFCFAKDFWLNLARGREHYWYAFSTWHVARAKSGQIVVKRIRSYSHGKALYNPSFSSLSLYGFICQRVGSTHHLLSIDWKSWKMISSLIVAILSCKIPCWGMQYSRLTRWFCDRICAGPVRAYKVLKKQCLSVAFRRVSFRVVFDITSDRCLNSKLILTDLKRFVSLKIQSNRPLS